MIIKLDATDSTNDFLKRLSTIDSLSNFTVITASSQTSGKGQVGSKWLSENDKNLIMSVLIKKISFEPHLIFELNVAISVSIIMVLKSYSMLNLSLKWPNDIMAGDQKMGGVLIENTIKSDRELVSIVGIGINVNQIEFLNLPRAISMKSILGVEIDRDFLIKAILVEIKTNISLILNRKSAGLWKYYHQNLYKINETMPFETVHGDSFLGEIVGVSNTGKLQVLKSDLLFEFGNKEVVMLY